MIAGFREVWLVDFEFQTQQGERPIPVCLVGWELRSGTKVRLWQDQFGDTPPYSIAADSLFVAYLASAELGCHLALCWPMPARILDLYVEFRQLTNGHNPPAGYSLLGALTYFGLDGIGAIEKQEWRGLILRGGPWTTQEQLGILNYCESDVAALARLLPAMEPRLDVPRALYRGRYMAAVAHMENEGVPIDRALRTRLLNGWAAIQDRLIAAIDSDYQVFDGCTFKINRFEQWVARRHLFWPVLPSGRLCLDQETFRCMSKLYPEVSPLRELRHSLSELRLNDLTVGSDGRNRYLLSPFRARSSRNCPSNSQSIFGPSVWLRWLIQPAGGEGLAYVDWVQQEFGIAAALSQDLNMLKAYESGDAYLAFAKQAGAVPANATKASHPQVRELYKQNALGVNYGMGEKTLAARIGQLPITARRLLEQHREIYSRFWQWSDLCVDHAMLNGWQMTVFGWRQWVFPEPNPCSLRNFHMQANGAEMLRLACCLATEHGIRVCAPIRDAVMINAPADQLEEAIRAMRTYMAEASRVVLDGFELQTESRAILHPDHYCDPRGQTMFNKVVSLL